MYLFHYISLFSGLTPHTLQEEGKHVVCHPLTHRCSCGPGSGLVCGQGVEAKSSFEAKDTVKAIFVPLKRFARPKKIPAQEGHGQHHEESQEGYNYPGYYKKDEERKNKTHKISPARLTANVTVIRNAVSQALNGSNEKREEPLIRSQRDWVMLVMMLMVALGTAAAITLLYLRALQERRMSQVALKSLIQFLSERDVKDSSVKTSEDVEWENQRSDPPANMEGEGIRPVFDFPAPGSMMSLPSKITLAPLEGENLIRFPSPHVSHAKLPAIRGSRTVPRKREKKKYEEEEKKYKEGGKKVEEIQKYEAKKIYEELSVARLESRVSSADTASMTTPDSSPQEDQPPSYEELLNYN